MQTSRYNFLCEVEGRCYAYQLLSGSLLELDRELYAALGEGDLAGVPDAVKAELKRANFLVEDDVDEVALVRAANLRARYRSPAMRVTVIPTLACNFSCWYCYEAHRPSRMSSDAVEAAIRFMQLQLEATAKKQLTLDWFGGEPLLCFDSAIEPMQRRMLEWCEARGILLKSCMTTNGSLVTPAMADSMEKIGLRQFQITLDGSRAFHNRTRFSKPMQNSYDTILENVRVLCSRISSPSIELRINYTQENVESLVDILDDLDDGLRSYVSLSPHVVWQESENSKAMSDALKRFESKAYDRGFTVIQAIPTVRSTSCYTENIDQFVVNYNLDVYKCTARDFDGKCSIGRIDNEGVFKPNGLFYRYVAAPSPFTRRDECLECAFLPCCLCSPSCLQKELEGYHAPCDRGDVHRTIEGYVKQRVRK